jgi:hypothetical protein
MGDGPWLAGDWWLVGTSSEQSGAASVTQASFSENQTVHAWRDNAHPVPCARVPCACIEIRDGWEHVPMNELPAVTFLGTIERKTHIDRFFYVQGPA